MKHSEINKWLPLGAMLCGMGLAQADSAESLTQLQTVEVKDRAETPAEQSYQGGKTTIGKVAQLPKDIPQSVTVVTAKLIEDRNANTFKEALRNVAGLTFNAGEGGRIGDNITIRGYSAVGDLYLDGMRDMAQYNRETFNLEQIDVMRGSSSMLFGRGSTGGVINQVSKQALLTDRNSISTTQGTHDYHRYTADLNQQLGDTTAVRFNAMKTDSGSFRDDVEAHRSGFAPTISFGIGTDNTFSLSHYHLEEDNIPDYGVPYLDPDGSARDSAGNILGSIKGKPLDVSRETFYGMRDVDYERNDTDITTAAFSHRFSEQTTLNTRVRWADYERDLWAVAPRLIAPAGTPSAPIDIGDVSGIRRGHQGRGSDENTITGQADLTTHFTSGSLQHELLVGGEILQEKMSRWNNQTRVGGRYSAVIANPNIDDIRHPDAEPSLPIGYLAGIRREDFNYYDGDSMAVYFQDVVGLSEQWKLLVGARRDHSENDYDRFVAKTASLAEHRETFTRRDLVNSWRTGLLFQPDDMTTYYVSRGSSFNPSAELYQLDKITAKVDPEKSLNTEIGAKWELLDGDLSLRTSLSRSEKTNERNTDLQAEEAVLSGRRHTDALEVEAIGRITPKWEVFSAVAYMEANIDKHSNTATNGLVTSDEGNEPVNTPHYTFSVWNTYRFTGHWRAGLGIDGVGDRYAAQTNTTVVPGYSRWDAMVEYEQKNYTVKLNLLNLLDREYYESVYTGHVVPGAARELQLKAEYRF